MKVIFVGLHYKPDMKALDSCTKSGKLIDKIIRQLPNEEHVKTNLFQTDYYPAKADLKVLAREWLFKVDFSESDIVVLLGRTVHEYFPKQEVFCRIINIAHPASKRSHEEMNEYVSKSAELINKFLSQNKKEE